MNIVHTIIPANIRLDENVLKTPLQKTSWSRRIYSPYSNVFRRRLEDVLIKTNTFTLLKRLQKMSWRRLDQDQYICLGHTSSRILQDIFKTSSRRLAKTSSMHFQDVFKTITKRFHAKTSSKRLEDILQKRLQDIFKTFWRRLQDVFKTSSRSLAKMSSRRFQDVSSS